MKKGNITPFEYRIKRSINMKEIDSAGLKKIQLNILNEIDAFCKDNNIRYILLYGTLLGAVRHKGYIPWDDDIDIGMPRDDYEVFLEKFGTDRYQLLDRTKDRNYPYAFGKVIDTMTVLKEPSQFDYPNMGVYVDVFAVDGLPDNEDERVKHARRANQIDHLRIIKSISYNYPVSFKHKLIHFAIKGLLLPISLSKLLSIEEKHAKKYSFDTSDYVSVLTIRHVHLYGILKKSYFTDLIDLKFEGHKYKCPAQYDEYLTTIYGDYMKLPPINEQVTRHHFDAYYKNSEEN